MTLKDFYQSEFGSDPYALLRAGEDELRSVASQAGIDWSATAAQVILHNTGGPESRFSKYSRSKTQALNKGDKGKVDFFSRLEEKGGLSMPFINFVRKGPGAGHWSGYDFLWSLFNDYRARIGTTVPNPEADERRRSERRARQEADKVQRENLLAQAAERQRREAARVLKSWQRIKEAFDAAPLEDGTHPYAVNKQISAIFPHCNVRRVSIWDRGPNSQPTEFMAIPLAHLNGPLAGKVAGWQRIYADGQKKQTEALEDVGFSGACHIIGSLVNAERVAVVEGFATGASVFLAEPGRFDAVVVAISANNMRHIVDQLIGLESNFELVCVLDNDRKGPGMGNTGLRTGVEILQAFPDHKIRCVYPTFEDAEGNDFNDVFVTHGQKETARQLKNTGNRLDLPKNLFEAAMLKLSFADARQPAFEKQAFECVDTGLLSCPAVISFDHLKTLLTRLLTSMNAPEQTVINACSRLDWKYRSKKQQAQAPRSFSRDITDPSRRAPHVSYTRLPDTKISKKILAMVQKRSLTGPVILRAPMGSGKTKEMLRPLMQAAFRAFVMANRVALMSSMHDVMQLGDDSSATADAGIFYYRDDLNGIPPETINKLTICINSIIKDKWQPLVHNHDFVGLDEATQCLRAILVGKAMERQVAVFNHLVDAFARTDGTALMADADANDTLVTFLELVMKRREALGIPGWSKIHVIDLATDVTFIPKGETEPRKRRAIHTDRDRLFMEITLAIKADEKILVATDSKAFGSGIYEHLREFFPDKKFLYVSQDTKQLPDVEAFTDKPNAEAVKYDALIYSPAISSGVSLEVQHFTRHFGMFCGQIVPSDAIQMLRRDRNAHTFLLGIEQLPGRKETSVAERRGAYADATIYTDGVLGNVSDVVFDKETGRVSFGLDDSDFADMQIHLAAQEAASRNDFRNNLLLILEADGYDVERLATDEDASDAGKAMRSEARERVWDQTVLIHMEAETPTEEERDALLEAEYLDVVQQAQLARYEIENELMLPVTPLSLEFLLDGGRKKLSLLELMRMDEATAAAIDLNQKLKNFSFSFRRAGRTQYVNVLAHTREEADAKFAKLQPLVISPRVRWQRLVEVPNRINALYHRNALRLYFETCGIDIANGTGHATREAQKAALQAVVDMVSVRSFNTTLRFGGYLGRNGAKKRPDVVFKDICGALGWSVENGRIGARGARVLTVEGQSFEFMEHLHTLRTEAGKSFYSLKHDTEDMPEDDDPDRMSMFRDNERSGSLNADPITASVTLQANADAEAVEQALANTPVPFAWVCSVLNPDEMTQLAAMPASLTRSTLAGLYLADHFANLSTADHAALKRLEAN